MLWGNYQFNDALTTFGIHGQDPGTFIKVGKAIGPLNMSVSELVFSIWFNPSSHKLFQNAAHHEWQHVSLIFDRVKNNIVIPGGTEQHTLINRGQVPIIK